MRRDRDAFYAWSWFLGTILLVWLVVLSFCMPPD